jgi:hypothetical protein
MTAPDPQLHDLALRHHMTYGVLPEWGTDANWQPLKTGFQIELYGVVRPGAEPPRKVWAGREPALDASHEALLKVAEWAFRLGDDDVSVTIDSQEGLLVHEPSVDTWVVEVIAHLLHSGDVRRAANGGEAACLQRIKERLWSLGIGER